MHVGASHGASRSRRIRLCVRTPRKRRQAAATYAALRELDDHMLHDLGFDRSEVSSVAAESAGEIERTRVRALPQS